MFKFRHLPERRMKRWAVGGTDRFVAVIEGSRRKATKWAKLDRVSIYTSGKLVA